MRKFLTLCLLAAAIGRVQAQQPGTDSLYNNKKTPDRKVAPWWVDRFHLSAGFFLPVNNTVIQVGNNTAGTTIDMEKDLGFSSDRNTFLGGIDWRISRRSKLSFSYFSLSRSASKTIDKDITFNDTTYKANATIVSNFNTNIYVISYGYAFVSQPTYEIGASVGAHVLSGDMSMAITAAGGSGQKKTEYNMNAPLPDLGIWGGVAFSKKLAFNASVGWLNVNVDPVNVNIVAYNFELRYKLAQQIHLMAGYSGLNFNLNVDSDDTNGYLKWKYNGPSFAVCYAFGKKKWD
jgi:hypothetical protein